MRESLLTLTEAAEYVGCSHSTVKRWVAAGRLPTFRVVRVVRVRELDLERFVALHTARRAGEAPIGVAGVTLGPGERLWD